MIRNNLFDDMDFGSPFHFSYGMFDHALFEYSTHWHQYMEIIYNIGDPLPATAAGREVTIEAGDALVIAPRWLHSFNIAGDRRLEFYLLQFDPMLLYGVLPSANEFKAVYPYLFTHNCRCMFSAAELADTVLPRLMDNIKSEADMRRYGYELAMRAYLLEICVWILRKWNDEMPLSNGDWIDNERFFTVYEYIQNHYTENISTSDMAEMISASLSHFCRTFKKLTGYSFINYMRTIRVSQAQKLLLTTDHTISQIAFMVGYSDVNFFIRSFKKVVGISPLKYKFLEQDKPLLSH